MLPVILLLSLLLLGANSFGFGALYDYEKRFLQAIDFTDVRVGVKEEAAYLAEKTPEQQAA